MKNVTSFFICKKDLQAWYLPVWPNSKFFFSYASDPLDIAKKRIPKNLLNLSVSLELNGFF